MREAARIVVLALAVTCGPPAPVEPPAASSARAAEPAPLPLPTASASVEPPAPSARPARVSVGPTTPGKVQCDTTICDSATEVCCFAGGAGRCVAKPPPGFEGVSPCCAASATGSCGEFTVERTCDETADCPSGERCCGGYQGEGSFRSERCEAKCREERCLPGSTCGNGNTCPANERELGSYCPLRTKAPRCGASVCAANEVCCWNREGDHGRCAAQCESGVETTFECTSPAQCDGLQCNRVNVHPHHRCGGNGFELAILCDKLADCPKHMSSLGWQDGSPRAVRCAHAPGLPTGAKQCVYE
jgi:hypothetical protein